MRILILIALLAPLSCAQFKSTIGSYAGMDIELGYDHSFINNQSSGGKKEGFFFPGYSERDEDRIEGRIRILLRPEDG